MSSVDMSPKANGRWQVRWRDTDGRRRGRTFTRKADAKRFAGEVERRLQLGGLVVLDQDAPTLAEWVETYWRVHAVPNLAPNTRDAYMTTWATHIQPRLGAYRLRQLTPGVISLQLVDQLRNTGAGTPTITKSLAVLGSILGVAVVHDLLPTNPVTPVRKPTQQRRDVIVLWPTTVEAIRTELKPADALLVAVLAYAGLRPEEALALTWGHIRPNAIVVERALARGELRHTDRNKNHDRQVQLLQPLASDLNEHRMAMGRPADNQLVFPAPTGGYWPDTRWRSWRRNTWQPAAHTAGAGVLERQTRTVLDAAGVKRRRTTSRYTGATPYTLRASFVSLLIQEGRNVLYVAEQAGHTPETSLRHYARLFRDAPDRPIPAEEAIRAARDDQRLRRSS